MDALTKCKRSYIKDRRKAIKLYTYDSVLCFDDRYDVPDYTQVLLPQNCVEFSSQEIFSLQDICAPFQP